MASSIREKKAADPEKVRLRMADLCARSEQCEYDIMQKLIRARLSPPQRDDIMTFLKKERFIDNARYARAYTSDKCRFSAWGPYKIRAALSAKRISPQDIRSALSSIDEEEWMEAASRACHSKGSKMELNGEDGKENRVKLYRFMINRGFESAVAVKSIRKLAESQKNSL